MGFRTFYGIPRSISGFQRNSKPKPEAKESRRKASELFSRVGASVISSSFFYERPLHHDGEAFLLLLRCCCGPAADCCCSDNACLELSAQRRSFLYASDQEPCDSQNAAIGTLLRDDDDDENQQRATAAIPTPTLPSACSVTCTWTRGKCKTTRRGARTGSASLDKPAAKRMRRSFRWGIWEKARRWILQSRRNSFPERPPATNWPRATSSPLVCPTSSWEAITVRS